MSVVVADLVNDLVAVGDRLRLAVVQLALLHRVDLLEHELLDVHLVQPVLDLLPQGLLRQRNQLVPAQQYDNCIKKPACVWRLIESLCLVIFPQFAVECVGAINFTCVIANGVNK
jgi:hypothetical protein